MLLEGDQLMDSLAPSHERFKGNTSTSRCTQKQPGSLCGLWSRGVTGAKQQVPAMSHSFGTS